MRVGSVGRMVTPRSSGGYAFESVEGSDEEGTDFTNGDDNVYTTEDVSSSPVHVKKYTLSVFEFF